MMAAVKPLHLSLGRGEPGTADHALAAGCPSAASSTLRASRALCDRVALRGLQPAHGGGAPCNAGGRVLLRIARPNVHLVGVVALAAVAQEHSDFRLSAADLDDGLFWGLHGGGCERLACVQQALARRLRSPQNSPSSRSAAPREPTAPRPWPTG